MSVDTIARGLAAIANALGGKVQTQAGKTASRVSAGTVRALPGDSQYAGMTEIGDRLPGSVDLATMLVGPGLQEPVTWHHYHDGTNWRAILDDQRDIQISMTGAAPPSTWWSIRDDTFSYLRTVAAFTGDVVPRIESFSLAKTNLPAGITKLRALAGGGQSNGAGYTGDYALATPLPINRTRAFMLGPSVRLSQDARAADATPAGVPTPFRHRCQLMPLQETVETRSGYQYLSSVMPSETPFSGIAYQLIQTGALASNEALVCWTAAVGSTTLAQNVKGSLQYANNMAALHQFALIAKIANVAYDIIGCVHVGHESDTTNVATNGLTAYQAMWNQYQTDFDTDAKAITGQTSTVLMIGEQTSSWTVSNLTRSQQPAAILNLAIQYPSRFVCVGPMFPFAFSQPLHSTIPAIRQRGEQIGRALGLKMQAIAASNPNFQPMMYAGASASLSGNVITVPILGNEGSFVFDTSVVTQPGSSGLTFTQTGGNSPTIVSAVPSGSNLIVTLSVAPTGTNMFIEFGQVGVAGANAGPGSGPRCPFRDSVTATRGYDGGRMYHYMVHQSVPVV